MSVYGRTPYITNEIIKTELKQTITTLWGQGYSAEYIVNRWNNAVKASLYERYPYMKDTNDFKELKKYLVWYYRSRFKLPPRRERAHSVEGRKVHRYKTTPKQLFEKLPNINSFHKQLLLVYPKYVNNAKDEYLPHLMWRAFFIVNYYSPLRVSEIVERKLEDFVINNNKERIEINLIRKKKPKNYDKVAPFWISINYPYVKEELLKYLQQLGATEIIKEETIKTTKPEMKPFKFSTWVAWSSTKKVYPEMYPHFWRYKWITEELSDPQTSLASVKNNTDLTLQVIDHYLLEVEKEKEDAMDRRLSRMEGNK